MTMPVDIDLNLDPSGYISGMRQSSDQTAAFAGTLRTTAVAMAPLQKAMSMVTPSRAMLAGMTAFVASAAKTQQQLSGVQATAAVTGVNVGRLTKSMRELAKEMPVGNTGSRSIIQGITQMGVAAKGSEARVGELAKTFGRLGGSTGEGITGLTQGMIQLSRTMNTGLAPKRVEAMADSLVEVTKATGTSATGVLGFSKAIAPLAQAAGIGQTSVMGISAAFSKMGEDGFAGATAVNKMLTDLNQAVREGSPQMATYAQIVGKTTGEFEALFKNNPAEALTQITEAIAKAGPRGTVLLEQLGLEGVRTQRALVGAVQSGDLRGAISSAVQGYGSGANEKASEAAYGGLSDALTKLRTVVEQAADAMGTPFLGAVTKVVDATGAGVSGIARVAESKPVQMALTAAAYAALPALIMAKVISPLLLGLGLKQGATSGPVRSAFGAFGASLAQARGQDNWMSRFGREQETRRQAGMPMGNGVWGRVNERVGNWAAGAGSAVGRIVSPREETRNLRQAIMRGGGIGNIFTGAGMYFRMLGDGARMARLPAHERTSTGLRPVDRAYGQYFNAADRVQSAYSQGLTTAAQRDAGLAKAAQRLQRDLTGLGGSARQAGSALGGFRYMLSQTARSTASTVASAGGAVLGKTAGALFSGMGITTALMGGMAISGNQKAAQEAQLEAAKSATSYAEQYNAALGLATEGVASFAGRVKGVTESIAASAETLGEGLAVNKETIRVARDRKDPIIKLPKDVEAATAMLRLQQSTTGFSAMQGSAIASDVIRQFGQDTAKDILGALDTGPAGGRPNLDTPDVVANAAAALSTTPTTGVWNNVARGFNRVIDMLPGDRSSSKLEWSSLNGEQQAGSVSLAQSLVERAGERSDKYGDAYASQEQRREMDAAVNEALKAAQATGDWSSYKQLVEDIQLSLNIRPQDIDASEVQAAGGFSNAQAARNKAFRENFGYEGQEYDPADPRNSTGLPFGMRIGRTTGPADVTAPAAVAQELKESFYVDMLRANGQSGNPLEALFSRTGEGAGTRANEAMQRLLTDKAADPSYQVNTIALAMQHFRDAGVSMADLAVNSAQAVNDIASLGDAGHQAAMALQQAAMTQMGREGLYVAPMQAMITQGDAAVRMASQNPTNADALTNNANAQQLVQSMEEPALQAARQSLANIRERNVAKSRAYEDYYRQRNWNAAAFNRQMDHNEQDFERNRLRQTKQFARQRGYAEADFERQRLRAHRDFGIQMARQAEDFARQTYDPYTRIQVQPTWDVPNLVGNLRDQENALRDQIGNLAKLRQAGLGDQAITLLGLNDPKNAQQAAVAVADIMNDPQVVGALNTAAANRQTLGAQLMGDPANTDVKRATEDFRRGMQDNAKEHRIQMDRSMAEFRIGMEQMVTDQGIAVQRANENFRIGQQQTFAQFATGLKRMGEDFTRANEVLVGDLQKTSDALQKAMSGQAVDWSKMTVSGMQTQLDLLKRLMSQEWQPLLNGTLITARFEMDTAVANSEAQRDDTKARNYAVSQPESRSTRGGLRNADGGIYVKGGATRTWGEESDEILLPLDNRGARFLGDVMQRLTSGAQLSQLQTAGTATVTHYHQDTIVQDYSTRVEGPVSVAADDPNSFLKAMQAKRARDNLTAPPQRRSGG